MTGFDEVDEIMKYEAGEMSDEQVVAFFQRLINSGLVWQLQGHYGRMATHLIDQGFCHQTTGVVGSQRQL